MTTAEALREKIEPDVDRHDQTVIEQMRDPLWVRELRESLRQLAQRQIRNWRDVYPGTE